MKEKNDTDPNMLSAILVSVQQPGTSDQQVADCLDELAFLALTAGMKEKARFVQRLDVVNSVTYVGKGKLDEIAAYVSDHEIEIALFDDELAPNQIRNIERTIGIRLLDRTALILDIFATRAQTAHAKAQVELAEYQYMLPRLTRMWTHLERQRGGVGMRGPGETQLETDRRIVLTRIAKLKEELKHIDQQKSQQRRGRGKMVRVALVGYTNVGKSTLMNRIAKSDVFSENKLFATLDTTVRKVVLYNLPFLLSDTVGFIRKLPTQLIESFKSTLDEVREADLLLHIVDISHPDFESQIAIVEDTLADILNGEERPSMLIFNKVDAFSWQPKDEDDLTPFERENYSLGDLQKSWMAKMKNDCFFISARTGEGVDELKQALYEHVKEIHVKRYPYNDFLFEDYSDLVEE
ncbi:GTPase HflX [Porphyromonas miyakawae]|uniref:GTPase HflX n=1 Tax=Porphyromonas miyakawae TaxID=3137470 RepID=A0ABQ0E1D3_9PORP